jgi:hypothetical protein
MARDYRVGDAGLDVTPVFSVPVTCRYKYRVSFDANVAIRFT